MNQDLAKYINSWINSSLDNSSKSDTQLSFDLKEIKKTLENSSLKEDESKAIYESIYKTIKASVNISIVATLEVLEQNGFKIS